MVLGRLYPVRKCPLCFWSQVSLSPLFLSNSSLNYLTPGDYYRGDPDKLLRIREEKIRMGRISRKETNMRDRKGGVMAGATP